MKWLVTLKRIVNEQVITLPWEIDNAPDEHHAKQAAEAEAEQEGIMDFYAEDAEAII